VETVKHSEFAARLEPIRTRLFKTAMLYLDSESLALDALDEAVYKGLRGCWRLRQPEYFDTWITRILINECHNLQRRRPFVPLDALPDRPGTPTDGHSDVRDAILRLPEKQRMVIVLHYMEGYKTAEIAKILRVPEETVRSRLKRARATLKIQLDEP
jgi:RNA polymerase sigma-70 factor (ECF subfamily)